MKLFCRETFRMQKLCLWLGRVSFKKMLDNSVAVSSLNKIKVCGSPYSLFITDKKAFDKLRTFLKSPETIVL